MRVGVEATLVAHHGSALGAGAAVWLVVLRGARQVSCLTDGAQLAAGHGGDLGHRVGGGGGDGGGHRRGPSHPATTHVHLEVHTGGVALALLLPLGCQAVPCTRPSLDPRLGAGPRVWLGGSSRDAVDDRYVLDSCERMLCYISEQHGFKAGALKQSFTNRTMHFQIKVLSDVFRPLK